MKTTLTVLLIINLYGLTSCAFKQHYYINQQKTWDDALQYCRTLYYNLSTFTNETEEQQFLQDATGQNSSAWVGLYKESEIWKWAGGEVATRISWDENQAENDSCSVLHYFRKKLHEKKCTFKLPFFCMTVSEIVMIQQTESWEGALEYCRDHYDDLASLNSKRRMDYAVSKITAPETEFVWIGLHFLAGEWFWISGDDLEYEYWSPTGQPQCPARNQHCGALDTNKKIWIHRDCEEKLSFLCLSLL